MTAVYGQPPSWRRRLTGSWRRNITTDLGAVTGTADAGSRLPGETTTRLTQDGPRTYSSGAAYGREPGRDTVAIGVADTGTRLRRPVPSPTGHSPDFRRHGRTCTCSVCALLGRKLPGGSDPLGLGDVPVTADPLIFLALVAEYDRATTDTSKDGAQ